MVYAEKHQTLIRFTLLLVAAFLTTFGFVFQQPFQAASHPSSPVATYSHGRLRFIIPYQALHAGAGRFTAEVLNPEDEAIGHTEQEVTITAQNGQLQSEIGLEKSLAIDDLVWHRVRYRFEYDDENKPDLEGTESISQILRRPVVHILGQQSYLAGGQAAVRVIVTDSNNEPISGRGSVRIELRDIDGNQRETPRPLHGPSESRGTTEAQFRFPPAVVGSYQAALRRRDAHRFDRIHPGRAAGRQGFHSAHHGEAHLSAGPNHPRARAGARPRRSSRRPRAAS